MTIPGPTEHHAQAFRASSSSKVITIPTRLDNSTGERIIRWLDIQRIFKDAEYILNGENAVLFMADDNLEDLVPLRISHCPGVVLEVVVSSAGQNVISSTAEIAPKQQTPPDSRISSTCMDSNVIVAYCGTMDASRTSRSGDDVAIDSVSKTLANLPVMDSEPSGQILPVCTESVVQETSMSARDYLNKYSSQLQTLQSGQLNLVATMQSGHSDICATIKTEMDKNRSLQEQILQMQQQMDENERKVHQQLLEKQEQILRLQQQALDRLAIIQSHVQAVLTQTYELHEYPIPRLFIVLPKTLRLRDKLLKPFSEQFRLYFLCECGAHTMSEGTKVPHKIHLAKHEGYDLDRPNEFFEKYGSYVLTLMQMIKFGITVAGVLVPSLAHLGVMEGIEAAEGQLKFTKHNIESLVDNTITFIEDQQKSANGGISMIEEQTQMDKLEVLEGADLRQLESYLKVQDKGRVLGNLYRIVTTEGYVKWVCIDHYRENYRASAVQQLRDTVQANAGTFIEQLGKIKITLASPTQAAQFYGSLIKARGVHELGITLNWDVSMDDLQSFAVAVTKAGIVCLTMWGQAIKGQTLDYFNRYRRFNPIVGLMSNARIQALHLVSFSDFFTRISSSHIQMASQLRVITMRSTPLEDDVSMGVLTQILENSPNLTELWLDTDNPDKAYQMILSKICILPKLKSLGLQFRTKGVAVELLMWSIKTMNASFVSITASSPPHLTFVQRGVLTHLLIKNRIRISDDARLAKILHENPKLLEISLKCDSERFHAIIELVASTRERWRLEGYDLQRLRLELTQDYRQEREDEIKSTVQFSEHSVAYDMFTHVNLRSEWRPDPDYLPPLFRRYGWSIVTLDAGRGKLDDDLALQLDRSTEERTSNLAALALDPTRLSSNGAECIDRVLSRSNKLQDFSIYLRGPFTGNPAGTWLLGRHKEKLTSLDAKVAQADLDIPCLAEILPMRRDLPRLSSLTILSSGLNTQAHLAFPQECVPWLAAMVSAPGNPIIPTPPSSNLSEPPAALYSVTEADTSILWEPLRNVWLYVFSLQSEEWKTVIKALDFSTLETLGLRGTDFSTNELHVLVECIPEDGAAIPLMVLDFTSSALFESSGDSEVRSLCETLTSKAPRVTIKGLFNNPCGEV